MGNRRKRRGSKKNGKSSPETKPFIDRAHEATREDVYVLSDQVDERIGARAFSRRDQIKAIEAILHFGRSDSYALWTVRKYIRDAAKTALEWQEDMVPGAMNDTQLTQTAMFQSGIWKGLMALHKSLDPEHLLLRREQLMEEERLDAMGQAGIENPS